MQNVFAEVTVALGEGDKEVTSQSSDCAVTTVMIASHGQREDPNN